MVCLGPEANGVLLDSDYIQIRSPVYIPHSAGRYAAKRFRKANCPIIERLTNSLMMHGANRYGLQCLKNLDQLPPTGAMLISAPLKIKGGSGSPLRVLALVPN